MKYLYMSHRIPPLVGNPLLIKWIYYLGLLLEQKCICSSSNACTLSCMFQSSNRMVSCAPYFPLLLIFSSSSMGSLSLVGFGTVFSLCLPSALFWTLAISPKNIPPFLTKSIFKSSSRQCSLVRATMLIDGSNRNAGAV